MNTEINVNEIDNEIELLNQKLKDLRKSKKELKQKKEKTQEGDLIRFTNKANEVIEGYGILYYCLRDANGKLHYKKSTSVEHLTAE